MPEARALAMKALNTKSPENRFHPISGELKAVLENTTETTSFHVKDERETKENRLKAA